MRTGLDDRNRTNDLLCCKQLLYHWATSRNTPPGNLTRWSFFTKKLKKRRSRRGSNPGLNLDRDQCYHYTTTPNTLSGNLTRILWMKATCLLHWTNSVVPETRFELATIALSEQRSDLTELLWNMFFILTFFFIHARARTWNLSFRRRTPFQSGSVDQ